jgi:MFS family permease
MKAGGWLASDLLRQPDFLKLWSGLTISLVGMQVSGLALPLAAVELGASAGQMGLISALRWLPYLLLGLLAGVWLDRLRRRPVLVVTHLGRAALLATVPAAALLGRLSVEQLYMVAFLLGALMVFSDGAYQALLPTLVARDQLVDGNSKFALSDSLARLAGPGLGGALVAAVTAPIAVAVDAVAFALDAALVWAIRREEPRPRPRAERRLGREVAEGLRWVFGSRLLRPIQLRSMSFICANAIWSTVYVLYATRELGIDPVTLGLVFAAGGPGAVLGSLVAGRLIARFGLGRPLVVADALAGAATLLLPLSALAGPTEAVALLVLASALFGLLVTVGSVAELSLRQGMTPSDLQGRMNATMRSLNWSTVALGSMVGGLLGDAIGLAPTLLIGAGLSCGTSVVLIASPVWQVMEVRPSE